MTERTGSFLCSRVSVIWAVLAVWACGAVSLWAFFSSSVKEPEISCVVGASAAAAFVLAGLALVRRSWARVPLVGVCLVAGTLVQSSLFSEKDPSELYVLGYFVLNVAMMLLGGVALFVAAVFHGHTDSSRA